MLVLPGEMRVCRCAEVVREAQGVRKKNVEADAKLNR